MSTDKTGGAVTQWFEGDVKPKRVGCYQRSCAGEAPYWWWDGAAWLFGGTDSPEKPRTNSTSPTQSLPWRGLADKP